MATNPDWSGNRNSIFKTLGASNHTDEEREQDDFYATDPKAIDLLVDYPQAQVPEVVWEPSCGSGCLSERLTERGHRVVSTDLVDRGYGTGGVNFFDQQQLPDPDIRAIVTNPPYKYATDYVLHALRLLPADGLLALFLKTTFAEGKDRWQRIFSLTPPRTRAAMHRARALRQERRVPAHGRRRRLGSELRLVALAQGLPRPHHPRLGEPPRRPRRRAADAVLRKYPPLDGGKGREG